MNQSSRKAPRYRAVLSGDEGKYVFYIRELGIIASGPDVGTAFKNLEEKKQAVLDEFAASGLSDELPEPEAASTGLSALSPYKGFLIRTTIVTLCALVVVGGMTYGARTVITSGINAVKIKPGEIHMKLLEDKIIATINTAADPRNEYSAEKREKLIESLRILVERYKPFIDEIRPLISGNDEARPPKAAKEN